MKNCFIATISVFSFWALAQDFSDVQIARLQLAESVYMLTGAGGNIGVSAGQDGILIVDDQFEPLAEKIAASVQGVVDKPVKYVVNTHYHGDHTGGNVWFKKVQDATVFAHDKVRVRMGLNEKNTPESLPVITYQDGIKFHFNGDTVHVKHLGHGHTDGDSVIYFEKANVLHAGDQYFHDRFPYIDLAGGGDVKGYMTNIEQILLMADEETKIIPGHGPLATKVELANTLTMIRETANAVTTMKYNQGKTLEEVIAAGVAEKYKSWSWGFIDEEKWIRTLYLGL